MKHLAILLLFLLSNNLQANIKVEITNNVTGKKYAARFDNQPELDAWKSKQIAEKSWGKPDRWERKEQNCLGAERTVGIAPDEYQECFYPVEYTIVETDISAEVNARQAKRDACQVLETKLKTPADLNMSEINDYLRCK